jgi:phage baseplate assembly protein W
MANIRINLSGLNDTKEVHPYLYRDMNSNIADNSNKTDIITNDDINAIFGSLKNLFIYSPGQRILNPPYGLNFNSVLYEPMNNKTADAIGMLIFNGIKKWEPRVTVQDVQIDPDIDNHTYYITITFTVNGLGQNRTFQFTHELYQKL